MALALRNLGDPPAGTHLLQRFWRPCSDKGGRGTHVSLAVRQLSCARAQADADAGSSGRSQARVNSKGMQEGGGSQGKQDSRGKQDARRKPAKKDVWRSAPRDSTTETAANSLAGAAAKAPAVVDPEQSVEGAGVRSSPASTSLPWSDTAGAAPAQESAARCLGEEVATAVGGGQEAEQARTGSAGPGGDGALQRRDSKETSDLSGVAGDNTADADAQGEEEQSEEDNKAESAEESADEDKGHALQACREDLSGAEDTPGAERGIEEESLDTLEWTKVCLQVAEFCDTPMAYHRAASGKLLLGGTVEESEALLEETAAALALPARLDFEGAGDIGRILGRAELASGVGRRPDNDSSIGCSAESFLGVADLCAVLSLLHCAESLKQQLGLSGESTKHETSAGSVGGTGAGPETLLQDLMESACWEECSEVKGEIEKSVNPLLRSIKDEASPLLSELRAARRSNTAQLLELLHSEGRRVAQDAPGGGGGGQMGSATRRRGRLCIPVRAHLKGLLPGSVVLDTSNTGATLFLEPAGAVVLNNRDFEFQAEERAEEAHILGSLTRLLVHRRHALEDLQERVERLDLACARGRHALWLGAVRPRFSPTEKTDSGSEWQKREAKEALFLAPSEATPAEDGHLEEEVISPEFVVQIESLRHPLLLGMSLKAGASFYDAQRSTIQATAEGTEGSPLLVEALEKGAPSTDYGAAAPPYPPALPVPIDIMVRQGTRVVVISGPNAGGKTLTLKTLGVAALMAKAGMFLPAACTPRVPWFAKVLADIGDEQSLEQSLSTFSGHVRRICRIVDAVDGDSLVLLDEVGSGTDPTEGSALARALLRHLAGTGAGAGARGASEGFQPVRLVLTTTHYAQLKTLKDGSTVFEDASVEFNPVTLQPTFRVLWGQSGSSNALSIAASRGIPPALIQRSQALLESMRSGRWGREATAGTVSLEEAAPVGLQRSEGGGSLLVDSLLQQVQEQEHRARAAVEARAKASTVHAQALEKYQRFTAQESSLRRNQEHRASSSAAAARAKILDTLAKFQGTLSLADTTGGSRQGGHTGLEEALHGTEARTLSVPEIQKLEAKAHDEVNRLAKDSVLLLKSESGGGSMDCGEKWIPNVGDEVLVKTLKGSAGTVVAVKGSECEVKLGKLTMTVKARDLILKPR